MARFYNNNQTMGGKRVTDSKPIDDRLVVPTQADLFLADTWDNLQYSGMIVSVIRDGDNNGIYMLTKASAYQYQLWDPNLPNYGIAVGMHGWFRIGVVVMDKRSDNEDTQPGSFGGDGTTENPYYVSLINGGQF